MSAAVRRGLVSGREESGVGGAGDAVGGAAPDATTDGAVDHAAAEAVHGKRPRDDGGVLAFVRRLPVFVLVGIIRGYQRFVSPLSGPTCKYYPSCSAYALLAIRRHGALRGTGLALWRLLRCNPWSLGGVDDVPPARHHR